ncbi:MAG: thioredoxin domain-containing protein [Alphaproteobacteria bacterium]
MTTYHISWVAGAAIALALMPAFAQDDAAEPADEGSTTEATVTEAQPADADTTEADADQPAPSLLELQPTDRVLGDRDAPVTIFEFSSLTCPHCAAFHNETLPRIEAELIDTGKANLVIRHFPLDQVAFQAATVADCVPEAQYYTFIAVLYSTQPQWATSSNPLQSVLQTAMLAGVPQATLTACVADESIGNTILSTRLRAQSELDVGSTPTFFVGGEEIRGAQDFDTFAEAVAAATPAE